MRKIFPSVSRQLEILGIPALLVCCAQPAAHAGQPYIPGYYGNMALSSVTPNALPTGGQVTYLDPTKPTVDPDSLTPVTDGTMNIRQLQPRAVIRWQKFDVGSEASVHFDQQSSNWKVLNRVMGDSYSQILGSLTAKGQVYLLNQNGIFFGPGSKINVHSLTASALNFNVNDLDFIDSTRPNYLLDFSQGGKETYTYTPSNADGTITYSNDATVANHGTITAGSLGTVFLIGPQVENNGLITAQGGDVGLFAGDTVAIKQRDKYDQFDITVQGGETSGKVTNFEVFKDTTTDEEFGGRIITEQGWTGIQGSFVNQEGLVRAVTALEKNGRIELKASNRVTTGKNSITEVAISASGDRKVVDAEAFNKDIDEITIEATEGTIEHFGKISAPGGDVKLTARDRVLLETGSSIDVRGTRVELAAADRLVEVQLNSPELRDAFVYKDGPLKGQKVQADVVVGLSLADISGYFGSMKKSAPELFTKGGTITLKATGSNGEVIEKQGALLDFSGGWLHYGEGFMQSTKVRIGHRIYDLQDVPSGVPIDEVLDSASKDYTRYGITDEWQGLYYGGSSSYLSYLPAFTQGADGGKLTINSRKVILDGSMNASVLRGIYQNALEDPTKNGNLTAIGRRVPRAGTLEIGTDPAGTTGLTDQSTDAVVIKSEVTPTTVSGDERLRDSGDLIRVSELSAEMLNASGLGTLNLYPNTTIKVEEDVNLVLAELGEVNFAAQNIEHRGSISIPSGTVNFTLRERNGEIPDVKDRIFLADTSIIDVSGRRLDNSAIASGTPLQFGFTDGGTVRLVDNNQQTNGEVILAANSLIDVSGGYIINDDHSITAGNGGELELTGNTVRPDGRLVGLALEGAEGGTLSIHADKVTVAKSAPSLPYDFDGNDELPENLQHHLILADNRFANTGFSHITLKGVGNILVEDEVDLAPSGARLAEPLLTTSGYRLETSNTVMARPEYFGSSFLKLIAGQAINTTDNTSGSSVTIGEAASLSVAPKGEITLQGDAVTLAGHLTARGGDIKITANNSDVKLASTASVNASGTTLPDLEHSLPGRTPNQTVVNGGKVELWAQGDVVLEAGSTVDVSGSEAVTNLAFDNRGELVATTTASAAGSISITYQNELTSEGQLLGGSLFSWLPGGSLAVTKTRADADAEGHTPTLTVHEAQVTQWQTAGFDDFTFSSKRAIEFAESALDQDQVVTIAANRGLTLNGSALVGSDGQNISLSAPWLKLSNIVPDSDFAADGERVVGTLKQLSANPAALALSGDYIDIRGDLALTGFAETTIQATNDLRLYDYYYKTSSKGWSGALRTAGNLNLQASAIYPGMHPSASSEENTHDIYPSSFTISTDLVDGLGNVTSGAGGKITIEAPSQPVHQAIVSAGGKLTLLASDIENDGFLAAPMGEIVLKAKNRIVLGEGSTLSTRGEAVTLYGKLEDQQWTVGGYRKNSDPTALASQVPVTAAPEKSIQITAPGGEIIQAPGAKIDVGGGGSIFAYEFLPGYDGSYNPLGKTNRYVILPDNSVKLPGKTVYLEGTVGLKAGTYSLLPVEYAFLPGALVVEESGKSVLPGTQTVTPEGYTMIAGVLGDRAISTVSPLRSGFIVRDAREVLAEGKFDQRQWAAGNAGLVEISSASTLLAGPLLADAMAGYQGGSLKLSGENIFLGLGGMLLDADWWSNLSFATELPADLAGKLVLDIAGITKSGLHALQLGDDATKTITLAANSTLEGISQVDLKSSTFITLEEGAQIHAQGDAFGEGLVTLTTNTLYGADRTLLYGSDGLTLNVDNLNAYTFAGDFQVDPGGTLQVNSNIFYLEPASYTGTRKQDPGLHLTSAMLENIDHVVLKAVDKTVKGVVTSQGAMVFLGNVNLDVQGDLTLDSGRFTVDNGATTDPEWGFPMAYPYTVHINATAGTLHLLNSNRSFSSSVGTLDPSVNINTINLEAKTIAFDTGQVNFDTFKEIHFKSQGDTVFNGTSATYTDLDNSKNKPELPSSLNANLAQGNQLTFSASRYISDLIPKTTENADGSTSLSFEARNYLLDGGLGDVVMAGNGLSGSSTIAMPGKLTVKGAKIELNEALFDMPGGIIGFQAQDDLVVNNSSILAIGKHLHFPVTVGGLQYDTGITLAGGQVVMQSEKGKVSLEGSTVIDTSAEDGQDGGAITLAAPTNGVVLDPTVKIRGDRLTVDTKEIQDFGALARSIAGDDHTENFKKLVDLRARTGDVTVKYADVVKTDHFILSADRGGVDIWGTIDASGQEKGGTVEISAHDNVTLESTGLILARGEGEKSAGGSVVLASTDGAVQTIGLSPEYGGGSVIDVSGNNQGGSVVFRASRDAIGNKKMVLEGEISGASEIGVHAFRIYEDRNATVTVEDVQGYTDTTTNAHIAGYIDDIRTDWSDDTKDGLKLASLEKSWQQKYASLAIIPEIEVRSSGDLTLASGLDTLDSLVPKNSDGTPLLFKPGIFTFKAAKDLKVTGNIIDLPGTTQKIKDPTYSTTTSVPVANDGTRDSWDLNFVAGADMGSARLLDVLPPDVLVSNGTSYGNFIVGTKGGGKTIYTESGDIDFAAGNTATIYALSSSASPLNYMPGTNRYNLASFDGDINGYVGRDLVLEGGVIQTAVSDIDLQVRNNITMNAYTSGKTYYSAIRTTGRAPLISEIPEYTPLMNDAEHGSKLAAYALGRYWDYRDGGDITLAVGGDLSGMVSSPDSNGKVIGWAYAYQDILTAQSNNSEILEKFSADYGNMVGSWNGAPQGTYQATHGIATMAGGNIAIAAEDIYCQIGTFDHGDLTVYARGKLDGRFLAADGDIHLTSLTDFGVTSDKAKVLDTLVELGTGSLEIQALGNLSLGTVSNPVLTALKKTWWLTYDENSSVTLRSALGDTIVSGGYDYRKSGDKTDQPFRYYLLPSSLDIMAGRDISFGLNKDTHLIMAPSTEGQLSLVAGRDLNGKKIGNTGKYTNSQLYMSAYAPEKMYGNRGTGNLDQYQGWLEEYNTVPDPLHINSSTPVVIKAGRDIANISLSLPKQTMISADRDIREINYWGQNLHKEDVSLIRAGGNLIQQPYAGINDSSLGLHQAGHGLLLVQAGDSIDLGASDGIQSTGNIIGAGTNKENSALFKDSDRDEFNRYKGADIAVIAGYAIKGRSEEELAALSQAIAEYGNEYHFTEENSAPFKLLTDYSTLLTDYSQQLERFKITGKQEDENKATSLLGSITDVFFKAINEYGKQYSDQKNTADTTSKQDDQNELARIKKTMLEFIINPLLDGNQSGAGNITMTQSKITTNSGKDNLSLLAAGLVDVGTSIIGKEGGAPKGLQTAGGGNINVFAEGDLNINESRAVTYFGGDIFLLSNHGDLNAGRGSNTSVSASEEQFPVIGGKRVRVKMAPIPGSGIRCLSTDPDGVGPLRDPGIEYDAAGNIAYTKTGEVKHTQTINLIAWEGVIDAGEAGISAGNVMLAATKVLNANNISFSSSGVGVPVTTDAGPSLGALTGASTVSDTQTATQTMGQQVTESGKQLAESVNKMAESLNVKMLVFKFDGFGDESRQNPEQNKSDARGSSDGAI